MTYWYQPLFCAGVVCLVVVVSIPVAIRDLLRLLPSTADIVDDLLACYADATHLFPPGRK